MCAFPSWRQPLASVLEDKNFEEGDVLHVTCTYDLHSELVASLPQDEDVDELQALEDAMMNSDELREMERFDEVLGF